jgi:hypothetical protein
MTDNDCRILAKACGLKWHGLGLGGKCSCGETIYSSRTNHWNCHFATPDDWELVRMKVVEGLNKDAADDLTDFIDSAFVDFINTNNGAPQFSDAFHWWITRTPKEQCQIAADFIKARPDLFPWVGEMEE